MDIEGANCIPLSIEKTQQSSGIVEFEKNKQTQDSSLSESMDVEVTGIEKENGKILAEKEKLLTVKHQITFLSGENQNLPTDVKSENVTSQLLLSSSSNSKMHRRIKRHSCKPLSSKKKKKLSHNIYKLSGKQLGHLLHIIQFREKRSDIIPEVVKIDLEKLKPATVRELNSYVASCLKKKPRRSKESSERHCYKGLKKLFSRLCTD